MPDYTKLFGKALELTRNLSPSAPGKEATLYLLVHNATGGGYKLLLQVNSDWNAEEEEESGATIIRVAQLGEVTQAIMIKAAAFCMNGFVYKPVQPNGKRPPIGIGKKIWRLVMTATGEMWEPQP